MSNPINISKVVLIKYNNTILLSIINLFGYFTKSNTNSVLLFDFLKKCFYKF